MASLIYLDTHVAAWLFAGRTDLLPASVQASLEEHDLLISPAAILELQYLFEVQRTAEPARMVIGALQRDVGLKVCDLPFAQVAETAVEQSWTRNPFDRLIVSQAILREAPLLTKDRQMRDQYPLARW